jgi:hypothetical protein
MKNPPIGNNSRISKLKCYLLQISTFLKIWKLKRERPCELHIYPMN